MTDKKLTNEQAINVLDVLWYNPLFSETHRQAFEIGIKAIKALEQEPCEDAISRQATLEPYKILKDTDTLCVALIRANIMQQPPVIPQPKTGHWSRVSMDKYVQHAMAYYRCSECGKDIIGEHNYCPNCGAKMQEVDDDE